MVVADIADGPSPAYDMLAPTAAGAQSPIVTTHDFRARPFLQASSPCSQNLPKNAPRNNAFLAGFLTTVIMSIKESIYDVQGRLICNLVDKFENAGKKRVVWDATNNGGRRVASGVYFYRIVAGNYSASKKMILLR